MADEDALQVGLRHCFYDIAFGWRCIVADEPARKLGDIRDRRVVAKLNTRGRDAAHLRGTEPYRTPG
jgi:hypothetical protein